MLKAVSYPILQNQNIPITKRDKTLGGCWFGEGPRPFLPIFCPYGTRPSWSHSDETKDMTPDEQAVYSRLKVERIKKRLEELRHQQEEANQQPIDSGR